MLLTCLMVRHLPQAVAGALLGAGHACLSACIAPSPQMETVGPRPEARPTLSESADGGTKASTGTASDGGSPESMAASRIPLDAGSLHAAERPCNGYSPLREADAHAAHGKDGGVDGRLPSEVIQKIVRTHFGLFRRCYENGMRRNPDLAGKITTKFVIGADGAVTMTELACTSLPDNVVVECVVKEFGKLQFPAPEAGIMTIVYPIMFNPGDRGFAPQIQ